MHLHRLHRWTAEFFRLAPFVGEAYLGGMKTKASARCVGRVQGIMLRVTLVAIVGLEVCVGASLAARIGHTTTTRQTDSPAISDICWPTRTGR